METNYVIKKTPMNGYKIVRFTTYDNKSVKKSTIRKNIKSYSTAENIVFKLERNIK